MTSSLKILSRTASAARQPAVPFFRLVIAAFVIEVLTAPITLYLASISFGTGVFIIPGLITTWVAEQASRYALRPFTIRLTLTALFLVVPTVLLVYTLRAFRRGDLLF